MKLVQLLIVLAFVTLSCAFGQTEPPVWNSGLTGMAGRSASLTNIDPKAEQIFYKVTYGQHNLVSDVILDMNTKAMRKEVFSGKWIILYEYSEKVYETSHLPTKFTIYEYGKDRKPGKVINVYIFEEAIGNGDIRYVDKYGKKRVINVWYFGIIR